MTAAQTAHPTSHGHDAHAGHHVVRPKLDAGRWVTMGVPLVLAIGVVYVALRLGSDLQGVPNPALMPFLLLGLALFIALGFEFVNGFHDTANAVATVIYTHSMPAPVAVVWSGAFNFLGVLLSSGAVAYGIVSLLPVELILQVGSAAGFAMVFALLIAAIIWNLGTWYLGLPSSSSHTLIGSIVGVGIANQLMQGNSGTSGVDWAQVEKIGSALLISPVFGFVGAAILLILLKLLVRAPALYKAPEGHKPPPVWIRAILVTTCAGVSFFHGSNDGQKGMGLIMLILIGVVPTAYALNASVRGADIEKFVTLSAETQTALSHYVAPDAPAISDARASVTNFVSKRALADDTMPGIAKLVGEISAQVKDHGGLGDLAPDAVRNVRNDMYLAGEAITRVVKSGKPALSAEDKDTLGKYQKSINLATRFIPDWVKVAVAIALGLGTMVGWKRIVITVGEKIGKAHLTYGQGASAEVMAMATIGAADGLGLPVSTTHVLSSGIAGTMAANGSGLQWSTVRNLALAWVMTLPASIMLSGFLFYVLMGAFG
jgi:PiT family inorganic phosphate transporter